MYLIKEAVDHHVLQQTLRSLSRVEQQFGTIGAHDALGSTATQ